MGSSNNFSKEIIDYLHQNEDKDELYDKCSRINVDRSCPCVGFSQGKRLVSTHPGYPGNGVKPCMAEITGQPIGPTDSNYQDCLLASICQHFFKDAFEDSFDQMCKLDEDCPIPEYTGQYSDYRVLQMNKDNENYDDLKKECNSSGFFENAGLYGKYKNNESYKIQSQW